MALTNKERMRRYHTKKKAKRTWKGGLICKCCGVKKEMKDFRERGRGRETVCLVCKSTKEEPKEKPKEKSEKRKQQNREAQQRYRDKKLEERMKKDGMHTLFFCEECEEWKNEDNFPVRGRGRGKVCLGCKGYTRTEEVCLDCKGYTRTEEVETEQVEKLRKFAESPAGQKMIARREEMMRKYGFDE